MSLTTPLVILCGGKSRRMGTHKGLLTFEGKSLLQRLFDLSKHPIYMAASGDYFPQIVGPCRYISDGVPNRAGPLSGILAGLEEAHQQGLSGVYVMACDTLLNPEEVIALLDTVVNTGSFQTGVVSLADHQKNYPLLSYWTVDVAPALRKYLEAGNHRVQVFLESQSYQQILMPERWSLYSNFNTPEEYDQAVKYAENTALMSE